MHFRREASGILVREAVRLAPRSQYTAEVSTRRNDGSIVAASSPIDGRMSTSDVLLRAVIASPDDDAPRLIYADWLDEQGDADRAEFIRVQCALAQPLDDESLHADLRHREHELLQRYALDWAEEFAGTAGVWQYGRGFIEEMEMSLNGSPDAIVNVLERTPIRRLRDWSPLTDLRGIADALPHFEQLTSLELWRLISIEDVYFETILTSPYLRNLKTLVLHSDPSGLAMAERALLRGLHSPHREQIEELSVAADNFVRGPSRQVVEALISAPHLRRLRKLDLQNASAGLGDVATIHRLGESPTFAHLEDLSLSHTSFSPNEVQELLQCPWLSKLKRLDLSETQLRASAGFLRVADVASSPFRTEFEQRIPCVVWDEPLVQPWSEQAPPSGYTWDDSRDQKLFAMQAYLDRGDFRDLAEDYRRECHAQFGDAVTSHIDSLDLAGYSGRLTNMLAEGFERCAQADGAALHVVVHVGLSWSCRCEVLRAAWPEPFAPRRESPSFASLANVRGTTFTAAETIWDGLPRPRRRTLDSDAARHYLLARFVAELGRLVAQRATPVPVYLNLRFAMFRLSPPPSIWRTFS